MGAGMSIEISAVLTLLIICLARSDLGLWEEDLTTALCLLSLSCTSPAPPVPPPSTDLSLDKPDWNILSDIVFQAAANTRCPSSVEAATECCTAAHVRVRCYHFKLQLTTAQN